MIIKQTHLSEHIQNDHQMYIFNAECTKRKIMTQYTLLDITDAMVMKQILSQILLVYQTAHIQW